MTTRTRSRCAAVFSAAVLVLAACGADDGDVSDRPDPVDSGDDASGDDVSRDDADDASGAGMRTPSPVRVTAGAGGPLPASGLADQGEASGLPGDPLPVDRTPTGGPMFDIDVDIVVDGVTNLPDRDTGYVFDQGGPVAVDVVQRIADVFGVEGEPDQLGDGLWSVGDPNGLGPSLWVNADAQQSWAYQGDLLIPDDCSPDVGLDTDEGEGIVACDSEPPRDLPDEAAAEAAAREWLDRLGVDTDGLTAEVNADEWGTAATFTSEANPGRSWSFGFGEGGALTYASGTLAPGEPVGPFPLVDLDTAIERVREWAIGVGLPVDVSVPLDGDPELASVTSEDAAAGSPEDAIEIVDQMTVTIVDVEPDLWWAVDVDDHVWLLPAYRFIDADGGWHVVPAVTDEFLIQVPPPPVEPVEPPAEPVEPPVELPVEPPVEPAVGLLSEAAGDMYEEWAAPVQAFLGLDLDRFEAAVTDAGFGPVRVVYDDGEFLATTEDFVVGRVNVAVETIEGVDAVVDAYVEGADQVEQG